MNYTDKSVEEIRVELTNETAPFFPFENGEIAISPDKDGDNSLKDVSMVIACSIPKEYLGSWYAACFSGMKLSVDPQLAYEFKLKMLSLSDEDLLNAFELAQTRASEIIKTLKGEM